MDLNAQLEDAVAEVADLVRGTKPDQLDAPTPCRDWDVRALVNHLLQVVAALRLAAAGAPVPDELWSRDLMQAGWADRFDTSGVTGTWEGTRVAGASELPASMLAAMLISDLVLHGWDLARATGRAIRCSASTVDTTYRFLVDAGDQGRAMGIFAAPVPVADDAPALDRAVALSGRDPQWTP